MENHRCAGQLLIKGLKRNDVIHLLAGGENLELTFVALGAMYLGIVPAFSDATLSDEALLVQVEKKLQIIICLQLFSEKI
jgi:hypothetical protein